MSICCVRVQRARTSPVSKRTTSPDSKPLEDTSMNRQEQAMSAKKDEQDALLGKRLRDFDKEIARYSLVRGSGYASFQS